MPTASPRDQHFLIPKPRCLDTIPALPDSKLAWLAGRLGPEERMAMRYMCETAEVIVIDGDPWLVVPVDQDHRLVDALATFEAEAEDREQGLDDEPEVDDDSVNDNPADAAALEFDAEPDVTPARRWFAQQRRRPQVTYTQMEGWRTVHRTNYDATNDRLQRQWAKRWLREHAS